MADHDGRRLDAILSTVCAQQNLLCAIKVAVDDTLELQRREMRADRRILRQIQEVATAIKQNPAALEVQLTRLDELSREMDSFAPAPP